MDRIEQQPDRGESGQAIVEAAIVLPAMMFLLLCAIQLTMLQQARLATEYAAFAAARAGIVYNANNGTSNGLRDGPMRDAAVMAILPSFSRADSIAALGTTKLKFEAQDAVLRAAGLPQVRVAVLNPTRAAFAQHTHLQGREIDFDDVRPAVAPDTLLSLQVRYYYQLRVPFANKMIQAIWLATQVAANGSLLVSWKGFDMTSPRLNPGNTNTGPDAVNATQLAAIGRGSVPDGTPEGTNVSALALLTQGPRPMYLLPVHAWYTMRMQSNPFLRWAR